VLSKQKEKASKEEEKTKKVKKTTSSISRQQPIFTETTTVHTARGGKDST
jgi:hypothetical protein